MTADYLAVTLDIRTYFHPVHSTLQIEARVSLHIHKHASPTPFGLRRQIVESPNDTARDTARKGASRVPLHITTPFPLRIIMAFHNSVSILSEIQ
jgi:hypothetical protein